MSTNLQKKKRITKQIRVSAELHKTLKIKAALKDITISKLIDEIYDNFLAGKMKTEVTDKSSVTK